MMEPKTQKHIRSYFLVKAYHYLWQLEQGVEAILKHGSDRLKLSVLGKMAEDCIATDKKKMHAKQELKEYWKRSLGADTDFGLFCNPEIGTLFIAGRLASQFLHDLDGRALGALSSGPYGILRGLGINESKAKKYINKLNKGWYLLLIRGQSFELDLLEDVLAELE